MKCLLLGGPLDGEVMDVEYPTLKIPILHPLDAVTFCSLSYDDLNRLNADHAKYHVYGHRFLHNDDRAPDSVALQYVGIE